MNRILLSPRFATATILTVALLAGCGPAQAPPSGDPQAFVGRFIATLDSVKPEGLPNEAQIAALSPYLDQTLIDQFKAAGTRQAEFIKASPTEKPPLVEGSLFTSLFEGPTKQAVGVIDTSGGKLRVMVNYQRADPASPDTVKWHDAVVLRSVAGGFKVVDIEFRGEWAFKAGESLASVLEAAVR